MDGWGEKQLPAPTSTPPPAPLTAPRKGNSFLPGDLLALSGTEEGGKLILTAHRGFFFFPPVF